MEESSMSNRLKRALVLVSLGGMAFAFGPIGWGCQPFAESMPYVNFVEDVGNTAVATGVENLFNVVNNDTLEAWFEGPVTTLYSDLWSGFVGYTYPEDPTYGTLLIN
jgi:hypothetical protein